VTDYASIRKWTTERKIFRLGKIRYLLQKKLSIENTDKSDSEILLLLDEAIVLFLEIIKEIKMDRVDDKFWCNENSFDILNSIFIFETDTLSSCFRSRLLNTESIMKYYRMAHQSEQSRLKQQLMVRGMI